MAVDGMGVWPSMSISLKSVVGGESGMGSLLWASFCFFCLKYWGVVLRDLMVVQWAVTLLFLVMLIISVDEGENEMRGVVRVNNALVR